MRPRNTLGMSLTRMVSWLQLMPVVSCYHPMSRFRTDLFLGDGLIGDHRPLLYPDQLIASTSSSHGFPPLTPLRPQFSPALISPSSSCLLTGSQTSLDYVPQATTEPSMQRSPSPRGYLRHEDSGVRISTSYPATSDKQHCGRTVRPTLSTSANSAFFTHNDVYNGNGWEYSDGHVSPGPDMSNGQFTSESANPFPNLDPLVYNTMSFGGAIEIAQSQVYCNSTYESLQQLDHTGTRAVTAITPSGSRYYGNPIPLSQLDRVADGYDSASVPVGYPLFFPNQLIYVKYPTASDQQ